jgi:hypothetical protein
LILVRDTIIAMPIPDDLGLVIGRNLRYANPENPHLFQILPGGNPVDGFEFIRGDPGPRNTITKAKQGRVSAAAVRTLCTSLQRGKPVHVDTMLSAGGNGRSVLEAALASTPNCWMQRVDGKKCLVYDTSRSHAVGQIVFL